jgi:uncharacterized small protein (DUF1192 family)
MAQEAQISDTTIEFYQQELKAFAELARADERAQAAAQPAPVQDDELCGSGAGCLYKVARIENLEAEVERLKAAQRQWVGLTAAEQRSIEKKHIFVEDAIRLTEAKLKEKNT